MSEGLPYCRTDDLALWRDLLKRAHGDSQLATKWMKEIGVGSPKSAALNADFDLAAAEAGAPATFYCPISFRIFRDPVLLPTGQTCVQLMRHFESWTPKTQEGNPTPISAEMQCRYERSDLLRWLAHGNTICPATGQKIVQPFALTPNVALRKSIGEWCATHIPGYLDAEGGLIPIEEKVKHFPEKTLHNNSELTKADLALAISLQEEELEQYSARSQQSEQRIQSHTRIISQVQQSHGACTLLNIILFMASSACTAVFVLSIWQGHWHIETLNINPLVGPNPTALQELGSLVTSKILSQNQWWRIISSLFVSSGVIHLFSAITCLWTLAKYLECSNRILLPCLTVPAVWLISGLAGTVASANLAVDLDSAGATAGTCGLLGAVWAEQAINWKHYNNHTATGIILTTLTSMFVVLSLLPLVGMWCQVVALLCGALLLPLILVAETQTSRRKWLSRMGKAICVVLVAGLIITSVLSLFVNKAKYAQACDFCHSVDCVDTRWWSCEATVLPPQASCQIAANANATSTITCPSGALHLVATSSVVDSIQTCNLACSTALAFVSPSIAPSSTGVLI